MAWERMVGGLGTRRARLAERNMMRAHGPVPVLVFVENHRGRGLDRIGQRLASRLAGQRLRALDGADGLPQRFA